MKNKILSRLLAVGLTVAMVGGLAGCGIQTSSSNGGDSASTGTDVADKTDDGADDEDMEPTWEMAEDTVGDDGRYVSKAADFDSDPITLTVFSERANYSGEQLGWSADVLKEKFNVKINIVPLGDGVYETRLESGNLGDIVVFGSQTDYFRALEAGMLFDWEEDDILNEYGSYIASNAKVALQHNKEINSAQTDGEVDGIYGIGYDVASNAEDIQSFFYTWDVRWDLYKELGYPEVPDLHSFVDLFKKMKEISPTDESGKPTYAVSLWPDWDGNMVMYVKATATSYYGYDEFELGLYDPATGKFWGALDMREDGTYGPYLEMLQFFNELYRNDLLDPDSMTATYDTMIEKVKKGGVFFSIFNYSGSLAYNTADHLAEGKAMMSLTSDDAQPIVYGMNVMGGTSMWTIGAKTEYPELCMDIINYLFTPEGKMTFEYGPQDLCWYYDEEGYTHFTEFGKLANQDKLGTPMADTGYSGQTYHDGELQINCTTWSLDASNPDSVEGETYNKLSWKSEQAEAEYEIQQDWRDVTGCLLVDEYMAQSNYSVSPASGYTMASKDDAFQTTWEQVTKCIVNNSWKAIYAKSETEFTDIVNEMISLADAYGYQECWDFSNEQAAVRKAAEDAVRQ